MTIDYSKWYSKFHQANSDKLHLAAHSHHYWPDVSFQAHQQYWLDSAKYVDDKWNYFFSAVLPATQKLIAQNLEYSKPDQIVFAPNTHEFVYRLISCLPNQARILSTDSEFYSFDRQIERATEDEQVQCVKIPTLPLSGFESRLVEKIRTEKFDMIFFSQVFFNSGYVVQNLDQIVQEIRQHQSPDCIVVVDGYHGFMAVPTSLKVIQDRIFYLSGSYKYAQGGEGACFLMVPAGCQLRPKYTGWFAGFTSLTNHQGNVAYSENGFRFAGATMDYSAIYRLKSVLELFQSEGLSVAGIHQIVMKQQAEFIHLLGSGILSGISIEQLICREDKSRGHFLAFDLKSQEVCQKWHQRLKAAGILTDYRKSVLRFGFGLHVTADQIKNFISKLK